MRRNGTALFHLNIRRNGVTASVIRTKRSVQSPVRSVIALSGSAPSDSGLKKIAQINAAKGARHSKKISGFATLIGNFIEGLVILLQIHPGIHAGNLFGVA